MPEAATSFSGPTLWAGSVLLLLVVPALMVLSALLERSGPIRLRHWAEEAGGAIARLYDAPQRFEAFRFLISVIGRLLLLSLVLFLAGALAPIGPGRAVGIALVITAAVATASDLLNRRLVRRDAERSLRALTAVYRVCLVGTLPLVVLLATLMPRGRGRRDDDEEEASEEEIEAFIDVGTREGILEPGEEDMVRGIVDFGETVVRSVMVPRIDIIAAPVDSTAEQMTRLFLESKHTRIPLYQDSIDQIVGVLHLHGLLDALHGSKRSPRELARPPVVVPETKPLNELLRQMQARGQQMAIAVDEHGGTAGVLTVEDLLEEIVGEIADEYDEVEAEKEQQPDGSWLLHGSARLGEVEELLHVDLRDEEETPYETVGGLVMASLGKVPRPGDRVEQHGLAFTVETVRGRRVDRVRVEAHRATSNELEEMDR